MNQHLSSEAMDDVLSGRPSDETALHLQRCARCEQELAGLRSLFGDMRESATVVADRNRKFAPAAGRRKVPRLAWGMAAAVLFLSVGAPLVVHERGGSAGVGNGVTVAAPAATGMTDEALLNSVQDDLSSSVPDSLRPLDNSSATATESNISTTKRTN